jgi:tetratricopeptide (TPR) repeat protein
LHFGQIFGILNKEKPIFRLEPRRFSVQSKKRIICVICIAVFWVSPNLWAKEEDPFGKGLVLLSQQLYDEAIKAFSTAIEIIPQDYQAYNYRGIARALKEDYDRAIADYDKAIEIRPRYAEAYNNRGFARTRRGDLGSALKDYSRALEINPFFAEAYNNKAWLLATCADQRFRDGNQAVLMAQKAVELNPDVDTLDTLAAAYAAAGNFEAAIDTQKKAVQKLLMANRSSEVPEYLPHLNSYKSNQSLKINYAAAPKTIDSREEKVSLKKQTQNKPSAPAPAQQVVATSGSENKKPAAALPKKEPVATVIKPSPTIEAQKTAPVSKTPKPAAAPQKKEPVATVIKPSPTVEAQKTAPVSKTPKPAAAPPKKEPVATVIKPSPTVKAQKTAPVSKTPKPAAAPATKKTPAVKPLPYTIQVSAYRNPQTSNRVAKKLIASGDPAFTSPIDISGKGRWYRVYIGNYTNLEEAKSAAADLKKRKFRYVNIAKKPYTVQVGLPVSASEAEKLKSALEARGYLAYSLPVAGNTDRVRVLIGAFESNEAAAQLSQKLKKDGFNPKIGLK